MYIAIYCVVILLFCGGIVALFCFYRNKEKKRLDTFNKSTEVKEQTAVTPVSKDEKELTDEDLLKSEKTVDAQFEDFELPFQEDDELFVKEDAEPEKNPYTINPDKNIPTNTSLERKFAEYENFLRTHMTKKTSNPSPQIEKDNLFEEEPIMAREPLNSPFDSPDNIPYQQEANQPSLNDASQSELDALANFDFDILRNKSEEEIDFAISSLPLRAQEVIKRDILGRKDID